MTREIITYTEFENIVGIENIQRYAQCVITAIEDEKKINQFNTSELSPFIPFDLTTRAKIIHNRICGLLEIAFQSDKEITANTWKQIFAVNFKNKVLVRHKKFRPKGRISASQTKQHKNFINQDLKLVPELFEQPTFIIGGYMMDKTLTQLMGVYFACYDAQGVKWFTNYGSYVYEQNSFEFPTEQEQTAELEQPVSPGRKKLVKTKIAMPDTTTKEANDKQ